jgi:hypothetical protein
MIVSQDHYINEVFHDTGGHDLTTGRFGTPRVLAAARVLAGPAGPASSVRSTRYRGLPCHHPGPVARDRAQNVRGLVAGGMPLDV